MISSFRKSLSRDESGQAIILGVVSMLVLAVGVMTTLQLGWAVKEKIQLQHAVDNAAYSTAAMVARTMNFISWTNRTIVAQYVSAMAFQSWLSYFNSFAVMVGQVAASLLSAAFALGILAKIPFLAFLEAAARACSAAGKAIRKGADGIAKVVDKIDEPIAKIVDFITTDELYGINTMYYKVLQKNAYRLGRLQIVASAASDNTYYQESLNTTASWRGGKNSPYEVKVNDGSTGFLGIDLYGGATAVISQKQYSKLFVDLGEGDVGDGTKKRGTFLMSELVNASRDGHDDGLFFESDREFGVGTLVFGHGDGAAKTLIDAILPSSNGATLMTRKMEDVDTFGGDTKDKMKENPLYNKNKHYKGENIPETGSAISSIDYIAGIDKGLPSPLDTIIDWLGKGIGELLPKSKVVGIQSTKDEQHQFHCKYKDVGIADFSKGAIDKACNKAGKKLGEKCDEKCHQECPEGQFDAENNKCKVTEVWVSNGGEGDENFCKNICPKAKGGWGDQIQAKQDAIKQCKENAEQMADKLKEGIEEALEGVFGGGIPARVNIDCKVEGGIHRFAGIQPYITFDIDSYKERVDSHINPYPSFLAAANKKSQFLPEAAGNTSALGFGHKYDSGKKFQHATIGKVGGTGAHNVLDRDCDYGSVKCSTDGYNFNHIENGEAHFMSIPGFHAWASSQVYYHRPGAWAEPPNFFNPYWKAKLSPVSETLTSNDFMQSLGALGELVSKGITQVILH